MTVNFLKTCVVANSDSDSEGEDTVKVVVVTVVTLTEKVVGLRTELGILVVVPKKELSSRSVEAGTSAWYFGNHEITTQQAFILWRNFKCN